MSSLAPAPWQRARVGDVARTGAERLATNPLVLLGAMGLGAYGGYRLSGVVLGVFGAAVMPIAVGAAILLVGGLLPPQAT